LVATLLAQARSFKLCISANSCQNSSDDFPDTKGAIAGETEIKIWKEGSNVPADSRWIWLPEPGEPVQVKPDATKGSSADGPATGSGGNPCAGRPPTYQAFEGACLPDRLVWYLKCVEKMGGNRITVTRVDTSRSDSGIRIGVEGKGSGMVVEGAGMANFAWQNVGESIRRLDERYGDNATKTCLKVPGLEGADHAVKGVKGVSTRQHCLRDLAGVNHAGIRNNPNLYCDVGTIEPLQCRTESDNYSLPTLISHKEARFSIEGDGMPRTVCKCSLNDEVLRKCGLGD
jgi:hypothetical protein